MSRFFEVLVIRQVSASCQKGRGHTPPSSEGTGKFTGMKWGNAGPLQFSLRYFLNGTKIKVMAEQLQIELEPAKIVALDALATQSGRRREELVAQALDDFLALEQQNSDAIREGLDDLAAGRIVPHEDVLPTIQAMRRPV